MGSWPSLGFRWRRQGLQAQGRDDRIEHQRWHRIFIQVRWCKKFLHVPRKDWNGQHQDFHRHKVLRHFLKRGEIIHLVSRQDREAQFRPGCQVLLDRKPCQCRNIIRNHLRPLFLKVFDLQQAVNNHLQQAFFLILYEPFQRHQQRKLQVFLYYSLFQLRQLLQELLIRQLFLRKQLQKLRRL